MRSKVEKLRRALLVGGVSLLLLLAGLLGYSRYRAVRAWRSILAHSGATLSRETNGFTYSQSVGGRTVFTLHAAKAVQAKDGKYALHDVSLLLYRQADGRADRIYGSDFEYDEKNGVATALGDVHMDLQVPGALHHSTGKGGASDTRGASLLDQGIDPEDQPETIHVKTSGLVYVRKLGVAATDQDVEFAYGAMQCHARGAEFDSGQSTVHLLADVQMSGQVRGKALTLSAARVDLDRGTNVATLSRPEVRSEAGSAGAADAVLHLTPGGLLQTVEASGSVHAQRGTQVVHASRAQAELNGESTLRHARFSGEVTFADENSAERVQGHAQTVQASFGPQGAPQTILAEGNVSMQAIRAPSGASGASGVRREITGERVEATFAVTGRKGKPELQEVKIDGQAHASGESYVQVKKGKDSAKAEPEQAPKPGGLLKTQVNAESLLLTFAAGPNGRPQPANLTGAGHTALEQALPGEFTRRSTGDRLSMRFLARTGAEGQNGDQGRKGGGAVAEAQVASAVQEGHVLLRSVSSSNVHTLSPSTKIQASGSKGDVTEATAQRVEFDEGEHRLSLTGQAHLWSAEGDLTAARVNLDSQSDDAEAHGQVRATLLSATPRDKTAAAEITHIAAADARFLRASDTAEFHGTDADPVRLWQGGSQLQAATVRLDRTRNILFASPGTPGGLVHAVFVQERSRVATALKQHKVQKTPVPPVNSLSSKEAALGSSVLGSDASGNGASGDGTLRVTSARLEYTGTTREATFSGGVRTSGAIGEAHSQTAVVFLRPAVPEAHPGGTRQAPGTAGQAQTAARDGFLGGSVEKVVLAGKVQMEQQGRYGNGEQLLYTADNSSFILTGSPGRPPRIVDAAQGSVTGTTLLFRTGDNTVVVAGDSAHAGAASGRVRTELNLHP